MHAKPVPELCKTGTVKQSVEKRTKQNTEDFSNPEISSRLRLTEGLMAIGQANRFKFANNKSRNVNKYHYWHLQS
jgi:hypothetical protein